MSHAFIYAEIKPNLICRAFHHSYALETIRSGAMALAPCQAGGVSLVGITRETPMIFEGVFYNSQGVTALDALIGIAWQKEIPVALFEALSDVDFGEDLGHMISVVNAMAYASQLEGILLRRTLDFISSTGLLQSSTKNQRPRESTMVDKNYPQGCRMRLA
jgi:hypothetical protein